MVKFADDTTLGGMIGKDESLHRAEVNSLVEWCPENDLELNECEENEGSDYRFSP